MVMTFRYGVRGGNVARDLRQKALARQVRTRGEMEATLVISLPTVLDNYHFCAGQLYRNGVALPRRSA